MAKKTTGKPKWTPPWAKAAEEKKAAKDKKAAGGKTKKATKK